MQSIRKKKMMFERDENEIIKLEIQMNYLKKSHFIRKKLK